MNKSRNTVLMKVNLIQIMSTAVAFCLSVADYFGFSPRFCAVVTIFKKETMIFIDIV